MSIFRSSVERNSPALSHFMLLTKSSGRPSVLKACIDWTLDKNTPALSSASDFFFSSKQNLNHARVVVDHDEDPSVALDVRRVEGADDVHVQGVADVRRLVQLALVRDREAPGVRRDAVIAMGVGGLGERGGRVDSAPNQLSDTVEADMEATVQDGGGVVGGESVDVSAGSNARCARRSFPWTGARGRWRWRREEA